MSEKSVIEILELLEKTPSRLEKEKILKHNKDYDLLRNVFVLAFDPYTVFYVNKFKMPPVGTPSQRSFTDDEFVEDFLLFLTDWLAKRKITGNAAKDEVIRRFASFDTEKLQKWCERILLKNLRCGVQEATINKIWKGSIKRFSVQLANTLPTTCNKEVGIVLNERVNYPVYVEPKLDGLRCIAMKANGNVVLFTRNGSIIDTVPLINDALEKADYDNAVLDGEIMGADWSESVSVVMSIKNKKDASNVKFHVFDCVSIDEWQKSESKTPFIERRNSAVRIVDLIGRKDVVDIVPSTSVSSDAQLITAYQQALNDSYEGIMLKDSGAFYTFKRSDSVLKMKPTMTFEGVIVGTYTGHRGSKREGIFSGFNVVFPNGIVTRVGNGYGDKLLSMIQLNPDEYVGKIVEVEGQPDPATKIGYTVDGKIRFPVFIRFRSDVDVDESVIDAGIDYFERSLGINAGLRED